MFQMLAAQLVHMLAALMAGELTELWVRVLASSLERWLAPM